VTSDSDHKCDQSQPGYRIVDPKTGSNRVCTTDTSVSAEELHVYLPCSRRISSGSGEAALNWIVKSASSGRLLVNRICPLVSI